MAKSERPLSASIMSQRTGFTLIEIILVLIILVLVASLGIPMLRGTLDQQELKYSADRLRGEWLDARVRAMEEGQIFCMRVKIGGSAIVIDRVLDTHFTAGLSSRQTTSRFDAGNAYDPFEKGGFTGNYQDFILRDPDSATETSGVKIVEVPKTVVFADAIVVVEERAAFYLGLTVPGETEVDEVFGIEAIMTGETRLGETPCTEGVAWSAPIFFYPDGSTSTAAVLVKNAAGRCIEIRLRGLTGRGMLTEITTTNDYAGELDAHRF